MHGPVLPGAVFMPNTRTEERHCGERCHRKEGTDSHHSGSQFSGNLLHKRLDLYITNCNLGYCVNISRLHSSSFLFWTCTIATARH